MYKTKIFAAYLPQFHITEDNNKFWGKGFTDWVGVKKATPQFEGHEQPRIPLNQNYYDLLDVNVIKAQVDLARKYGINGFNIYHYWFKNGKQELEKPAELLLNNPDIDINYFFTWDNSSWCRTWGNIKGNDWAPAFDKKYEGKGGVATLVPFEYGNKLQWNKHFEYLLPFFKDERYYKVDNKPVFMFISHNEIRTLLKMGHYWDECAKNAGFSGMYMATKKRNFMNKPLFDSVFSYEPETSAWGKRRAIEKRLSKALKIKPRRDEPVKYQYSYEKVWNRILRSAKKNINHEIIGSFVRYDDTPRRGKEAMIITGESPKKFEKYFSKLYKFCCEHDTPFLLLTAWNEWGEGAYIEPDEIDKYEYLESLRKAINE